MVQFDAKQFFFFKSTIALTQIFGKPTPMDLTQINLEERLVLRTFETSFNEFINSDEFINFSVKIP